MPSTRQAPCSGLNCGRLGVLKCSLIPRSTNIFEVAATRHWVGGLSNQKLPAIQQRGKHDGMVLKKTYLKFLHACMAGGYCMWLVYSI